MGASIIDFDLSDHGTLLSEDRGRHKVEQWADPWASPSGINKGRPCFVSFFFTTTFVIAPMDHSRLNSLKRSQLQQLARVRILSFSRSKARTNTAVLIERKRQG